MKSGKYLRDARHLEKFMFTVTDDRFYEPLESHYRPSQEYLTLVTDMTKEFAGDWVIRPDGFWFHVYFKDFTWPVQGWKAHVSSTIGNGASILRRAAKICLSNRVPFKFALDNNVLAMMSSKRWARGGSGKFITIYPPDLACFKDLMEQLYAELHSEEGPYILSDKRYKDCRVLYYRYGGIERVNRVDITGEKIPVLISPEGAAVPDVRTPYFAPPPWAEDPFPCQKPDYKEIILNDKYVVKKALNFSNSGGVYLAQDRTTGKEVVIKEARSHTAGDHQGRDAVTRLTREAEILKLLRETRIGPEVLDSFRQWENFFVVEEYLTGVNVREVLLAQSPLMKVRPTLEDTSRYYEVFRKIFKSFAQALNGLHQRGIVFGDLSARNLKIDPSTYAVRLIDFEGAFRFGIDDPVNLYTPEFSNALRKRQNTQNFDDDLYSLAAIMLYMMFPIAALSLIRTDVFDTILKTMVADIGWSQTEIFKIISGLSKNEITCARACELLNEPATMQEPRFTGDVDSDSCEKIVQELGSFVLANMRPDKKEGLFPADAFMHRTNPLGLGLGACGVLYALKKCGFQIPQPAYDWLDRELAGIKPKSLAPGLLTGASGIAWILWELGFENRAAELMEMANQSTILKRHHSYLHGMAGVGLANLHLYLRTSRPEYLAMASELGDSLLRTAQQSDRGIYWEADKLLHIGFGYGQSGVALFFLRLFQLSGEEKFLAQGKRALEFDLSHRLEFEKGVLSFPRAPGETTLLPYLEEGSAGIARVAMRYGMWDRMEMMLQDAHRKYSGFAGLFYGLGSFVDVFTDAFLYSNDARFLQMAKRPISGIRELYLMKQPEGLATPGDNLFRISCDYATGVAGVMRALHRFTHLDEADFVLDEAASAAAARHEVHSGELSV